MKCHIKDYLKNYINQLTYIIYSTVHINVSHYVNVCLVYFVHSCVLLVLY